MYKYIIFISYAIIYADPLHEPVSHQLSLDLGSIACHTNARVPRPIPEIVSDLFSLSEAAPSGLVWKVDSGRARVGKAAGTPTQDGKYYLVTVKGHGQFYAHRVIYYLKNLSNPGHMIVRHLSDGGLALGSQKDNLQDEKGIGKKPLTGYTTKKMYEYNGQQYNLTRLCKVLNLSYGTAYQRLKHLENPKRVFEDLGYPDVNPLF
jgi:hypothetical protein